VSDLGGAWLTKDFFFAPCGKFCLIISAQRQSMTDPPQGRDKLIALFLFEFYKKAGLARSLVW
jgi:hypothetical protein